MFQFLKSYLPKDYTVDEKEPKDRLFYILKFFAYIAKQLTIYLLLALLIEKI